jgi:hypothetical protein
MATQLQGLSFVQFPMQARQAPRLLHRSHDFPGVIEVQIQRGDTKVVAGLPMSGDSAAWVREVLG